MNGRCLFVVRDLCRQVTSAAALLHGEEALSSTQASGLLVAESLARRGREIGLRILYGQSVDHSYGDDPIIPRLNALGLKPLVWTQLPASWSDRTSLGLGRLNRDCDGLRHDANLGAAQPPTSTREPGACGGTPCSDERAANSSKNS
jgi:hypothetical protein